MYGIVAPSFGLPTAENKAWNSNNQFVVAEHGVLVFETGPSESIGNEIRIVKQGGQLDVEAFSRMIDGAIGSTQPRFLPPPLPQEEKRNLDGLDVAFIFTNGGYSPGNIMMYRLLYKNFD